MAKYKDFDMFFQEHKREPLIFKLFDKQYNLPPALPAALMVRMLRASKDEEFEPQTIIEICEGMLGKAQFIDLMAQGVDVEQLENIIRWAVQNYGGGKVKNLEDNSLDSLEEDAANFTQEK